MSDMREWMIEQMTEEEWIIKRMECVELAWSHINVGNKEALTWLSQVFSFDVYMDGISFTPPAYYLENYKFNLTLISDSLTD